MPLILTAVAAEPNLTVNAFIYSQTPFRPLGHPVVTIDPNRLAIDRLGRSNYPMVLSRTIDEAGGDGFAIEYRGYPVTSQIGQSSCCTGGDDYCHLAGDGQCQCPGSEIDAADCQSVGDLGDGIALLNSLSTRYQALTRITTRVSSEEMTFDPAFEPDDNASFFGQLYVNGTQPSLNACKAAVLDQAKLRAIDDAQLCASVYCGPHGQCVVTTNGPACQCAADYVAQQFTDLDTQPSVTCVPRVPPVDLRADGIQLPDACANVSCGAGQCIDRNGVAVCACNDGTAATASYTSAAPSCAPVTSLSGSPGAQDFSEQLRGLKVCAPRPPVCGEGGWLEKTGTANPGVDCGDSEPDPALTREPPAPSCPGLFSCDGCDTPGPGAPIGGIAAGWLVALVVFRRRRRA